jgi:hypothetical protein
LNLNTACADTFDVWYQEIPSRPDTSALETAA